MPNAAMENGGSDSTMHVLVWGIILLGGIGVFIVWGLANAYPLSLRFLCCIATDLSRVLLGRRSGTGPAVVPRARP